MADRKELKLAYKQAARPMGICQVRNLASGKRLIEATPDIAGWRNRTGFTLRLGVHTCKALQADWNAQGADAFAFEVLETLGEEAAIAADAKSVLKNLEAAWLERLRPFGDRGYHVEKQA